MEHRQTRESKDLPKLGRIPSILAMAEETK